MSSTEERKGNIAKLYAFYIQERVYMGVDTTDEGFNARAVRKEHELFTNANRSVTAYRNQMKREVQKQERRVELLQRLPKEYKPMQMRANALKGKFRVINTFKNHKELIKQYTELYNQLHEYAKVFMTNGPTPDLNKLAFQLTSIEEKVNMFFNQVKRRLAIDDDDELIRLESVTFGLLERAWDTRGWEDNELSKTISTILRNTLH